MWMHKKKLRSYKKLYAHYVKLAAKTAAWPRSNIDRAVKYLQRADKVKDEWFCYTVKWGVCTRCARDLPSLGKDPQVCIICDGEW